MAIKALKIAPPLIHFIALAAVACVVTGAYFFSKWCFANVAATNADMAEVAEFAARISPRDPQTHFAAAVLLERTFLPDDFARSLRKYEMAAAMSPSNYLIWVELGKALDRHGEEERAEQAIRKAVELAPNHASPRWTLGNLLFRHGKTDEGFEQMRYALSSNPSFAEPTVLTAYQVYQGDFEQVRRLLGDDPAINAALLKVLTRQQRLDEAFSVWRAYAAESDRHEFQEVAVQLGNALVGAKKFRKAFQIFSAGSANVDAESSFGVVTNGGFETEIKTENAGAFEWQIAESSRVQIALIEGQRHSGSRSLRLGFNVVEGKDFRGLWQYVAVVPGKRYRLEWFYKSELKTAVPLKWEVTDAVGEKVLTASQGMANLSEWSQMSTSFFVANDGDGVIIRLSRANCPSAICPLSGTLFLDDISLSAE